MLPDLSILRPRSRHHKLMISLSIRFSDVSVFVKHVN